MPGYKTTYSTDEKQLYISDVNSYSNPATSLLSEHIKDSIRYRECLIWAQKPQIFPDPQYFN